MRLDRAWIKSLSRWNLLRVLLVDTSVRCVGVPRSHCASTSSRLWWAMGRVSSWDGQLQICRILTTASGLAAVARRIGSRVLHDSDGRMSWIAPDLDLFCTFSLYIDVNP